VPGSLHHLTGSRSQYRRSTSIDLPGLPEKPIRRSSKAAATSVRIPHARPGAQPVRRAVSPGRRVPARAFLIAPRSSGRALRLSGRRSSTPAGWDVPAVETITKAQPLAVNSPLRRSMRPCESVRRRRRRGPRIPRIAWTRQPRHGSCRWFDERLRENTVGWARRQARLPLRTRQEWSWQARASGTAEPPWVLQMMS
jgi:hypothetical protein